MNKNREKIETLIDILEKLGKQFDFRNLETAIVIWLRGNLNELTDKQLEQLDNTIWNYDGSLLNEDIKNYYDDLILPF